MNTHPYRDFVAQPKTAGRVVPAEPRDAASPKPAIVAVEFGSGWYHDVAIKTAQQATARGH